MCASRRKLHLAFKQQISVEVNMNLFDVCEKCNRQVKKVTLAFNTQQEAVHVLFKLASFTEDFLRITFSRLCQFIGGNQQLLSVCDRILTHSNRCTATLTSQ